MTEYTAASVRALIEGIEPLKVGAPSEENLEVAVETLEGLEELLTRLPAAERRAAISGVAIESGDALWVPAARNCRLSVGVAIEGDGLLSFAVGDENADGGALTTHFSAKTAAAHALRGAKRRIRYVESDENPFAPDEPSAVEGDGSLVESLKASGWAVPIARRPKISPRNRSPGWRGFPRTASPISSRAKPAALFWLWPAPPRATGGGRPSDSRARPSVCSPPGGSSASSSTPGSRAPTTPKRRAGA